MSGQDVGTPGSNAEGRTPLKPPAVKDRQCQYCQEFFTSSSLGRHLDQFIKEEKPKPPDGKHDVEEIQRRRGGVTRRQARLSSAKRDITASGNHSLTPDDAASPPSKRVRHNTNGEKQNIFNRASLETTGVMPDLASVHPSQPPYFASGTMDKADLVAKERQTLAERDEGRAAKLALMEVLDNLKAATAQSATSSPYLFDFLAESFPSLVLLMLPRQSSISSAQIIPSAKSWPIEPPSKTHFDLIRKSLSFRLDEFTEEQRNARNQRNSEDSLPSDSSPDTDRTLDFSSYHEHLGSAYTIWDAQSEIEKQKQWHLSSLRAFAREQEMHNETQARLARSEQLLAHQGIQMKRLNELQQPQEFLIHPPKAGPYALNVARAVISKLSPDNQLPSLDGLIAKWRPNVQNNRGFQRGFVSQLYSAVYGLEHNGANGVEPRPQAPVENDGVPPPNHDGGDSVDASGEDDDDLHLVADSGRGSILQDLDRGVLDPSLRGADTEMRDMGDFGAEGLLGVGRKKTKR